MVNVAFFLVCEDYWGGFDILFPACAFSSFFFPSGDQFVCTSVTLLGLESVDSGSASCNDCE